MDYQDTFSETMQSYEEEYVYNTFKTDVCAPSSSHMDETKQRKYLTSDSNGKSPVKKKRSSKKKVMYQEVDESDFETLQENFLPPLTEYETEIPETEETEEILNNISEETIDWPQEDFQELVKRIETIIPEQDSLSYSTRIEKLNWDEVAFNTYSGEKCKRAWLFVQKKIRRYRLLVELLQDAKELLTTSWPTFLQNKSKRHPDMPKRPMTAYIIFYMKKKDNIIAENPGIELPELSKRIGALFRSISEAKKEKYIKLAAEERKKYEIKLEEFYQNHPEIPRNNTGTSLKMVDNGPKKPQTPFTLYFEEQIRIWKPDDNERAFFREQCKDHYKHLSDQKKLVWIDLALDNESKYQLHEKYQHAYTNYLESLPEDQRQKEIECSTTKRKKPQADASNQINKPPTKKRKPAPATVTTNELSNELVNKEETEKSEECEEHLKPNKNQQEKIDEENAQRRDDFLKVLQAEPPAPPMSGLELFSTRYHGRQPVEIAWRKLNKVDKKEYQNEVEIIKEAYIKDYEKFLKSLTKEQLTTYSQFKKKCRAEQVSGESSSN